MVTTALCLLNHKSDELNTHASLQLADVFKLRVGVLLTKSDFELKWSWQEFSAFQSLSVGTRIVCISGTEF